MGGRAGGGAAGGMGSRSRGGASLQRMQIQYGSKEYGWAQMAANDVFGAGNFSRKDYAEYNANFGGMAFGKYNVRPGADDYKEANKEWDKNHKFLTKVLGHVAKHGTDFEKSVASSISKTMKSSTEKAKQVAFVSQKQAWVIGKALVETHFNGKY